MPEEFQDKLDAAVGAEDTDEENVTRLPNNVGPNAHVAIAPNGYIRFTLGFDLMHTTAFCDASVARGIADMLYEAADAQEEIMEEIQSQEGLKNAANVVNIDDVPAPEAEPAEEESDTNFEPADGDVPVEEANAHEEDVKDAVEVDANPERWD